MATISDLRVIEFNIAIVVICPKRSESGAWRGVEAKSSITEFQKSPKC